MDTVKPRRRDRRRPNSDCTKCKHAKFDEIYGEIKCLKKEHRIYDPEEYTGCKDYVKR